MKVPIPTNQYIQKIEVNDGDISIEFGTRKKVALLFICLNDRYWPYIAQVIKDCRKNFLPHHKVDYFVWTDYTPERATQQLQSVKDFMEQWNGEQDLLNTFMATFANSVRLYNIFYPEVVQKALADLSQKGLTFRAEGPKYWFESTGPFTKQSLMLVGAALMKMLEALYADLAETFIGVSLSETDSIEWPAPTLMRYHLFLNKKEELENYDHLFYLDADMRVPGRISDEIMTPGLLAAEHPMYSLKPQLVPPYEPNENSTAYIKRPGQIVDENGKPRFKPYYLAGGFQGGERKPFMEAMEAMRKQIDTDFDHNYTAIWNDESHWNKYVYDHYHGPLTVLSPAYIYPDSLIKEYYEPIWGKSYEPKIITLTKPFSLSAQGGEDLQKMMGTP